MDGKGVHHLLVAGQIFYAVDCSLDALPRYLLKVLYCKIRDLVVFCFLDNRMSKWMLRELFQRCSHLKKSGFRHFRLADNIGHHRFSLGDCTRLIHDNRLDRVGGFQRLCGLDQNSVCGAAAGADHDCGRSRKSKRTWTGDNQNGNGDGQRKFKGCSQDHPDNSGNNGNGNDNRDENAGYLICKLCDRSLGTGRFIHETDNLCKSGFVPDFGCLHFEISTLIDSCADNFISGLLVNRNTFACYRRFINGGRAFHQDSVYRDGFAGLYNQYITFFQFFHRNCGFHTVTNDGCGLRGKVQKLVDGIGSPAFCTCLEKLAEGDQRQDRACTLKVQVVGKLMHHRDIPVSETE